MPEFLSPGMVTEMRRFHGAALMHTYTRIPLGAAAPNPDDPWGEMLVEDGTPIPGLRCMLTFAETTTTSERGSVTQKRPLLWVDLDDTLQLGDRVEQIRDAEGRLLLTQAVVMRWEAGADFRGALTNLVELAVTEAVPQPAGGS